MTDLSFLAELSALQQSGDAPNWLTLDAYNTLKNGNYLLPGETPRGMWERVSKSVASYQKGVDWYEYFDLFWKNWLCGATPVLANVGTNRGLPASCFGVVAEDSLDSIYGSLSEVAMLTKNGGGVGKYYGKIRGRGAPISNGGFSEGIIPWLKIEDSSIIAVSQSSVRRGSLAAYLDIDHPDILEFLDMRKPAGDVNRRCVNLNHAVCIPDSFMQQVSEGDPAAVDLWLHLLTVRISTGQPYIQFNDNINNNLPQAYINHNMKVLHSNLCSEILLPSSSTESYVCILSSLNLTKWDEWKDSNLVRVAIRFLDGVCSEFLDKALGQVGMEKAVRFVERHRALGLGVLGFHSLLQSKNLAFDSLQAKILNRLIFKTIREEADKESSSLAYDYGSPLYCREIRKRNTTLLALAPTTSNSIISSDVSQSIEPWAANIFSQPSAKGTFIRKNPYLVKLLQSLGQDTIEVWASINEHKGSVAHLDFLSDEHKDVFKTAREINQHVIIGLAADRQEFIDQGQSLNVFFNSNADPLYVHEVHLEAWRKGIRALYYLRAEGVLSGDSIDYRSMDECTYCES